MTTTTFTEAPTTGSPVLRRVVALAAMELRLLVRNKTALVTAVGFAPLMVFFLMGLFDDADGARFSASLLIALVAFALLFIPYYNLTTATVARREELMLKRSVSSETSRGEVLVGMAVPGLALVLAQSTLTFAVLAVWFEPPALVNPLLALVTIVLGTAVFALLGFASTGFTRSVESAQLTTMPVLMAAIAFGGLLFPLDALPAAAERAAQLTPLAPVVHLLHLSVTGIAADGATVTLAESFSQALMPLAVLVAWVVVGAWATRRWMRWDPRR